MSDNSDNLEQKLSSTSTISIQQLITTESSNPRGIPSAKFIVSPFLISRILFLLEKFLYRKMLKNS
jgi:hypothetical protein